MGVMVLPHLFLHSEDFLLLHPVAMLVPKLVQMIPTFSLLWVGMVHDFWMYRDDPDFVRGQIPGTRSVLEWFLSRQRSDGLIGKIPWWPFVDWGKDFGFGMPPQGRRSAL